MDGMIAPSARRESQSSCGLKLETRTGRWFLEAMQAQQIAGQHHRDIGRCRIGTAIDDPNIDYAKLAQSMGWYAEGPITDPNDLGPAIRRALAVVEKGEPALLDAVTQPV